MFEFTLSDRTMGHFSTPPIMLYFVCGAVTPVSVLRGACMHIYAKGHGDFMLYYVLCVGQFQVETPTNGALPTAALRKR